MRNFFVAVRWFVLGTSLFLTQAAFAEEAEMDMDLMQTIEDTNDSLSSNVALEEGEAALADAQSLQELFVLVEDFFKHQPDSAEALELTIKSKHLLGDIVQQVNAGDFENAANSATDLARACKTCHNFYKED
jgi:soluble cytochrome b562